MSGIANNIVNNITSGSGDSSHSPINITRDRNSVSITAYVNITGDAADSYVPGGYALGGGRITYRQAILEGIAGRWSGNFDGLFVNISVIELNSSTHVIRDGQQFLNIEIKDGAGVSVIFPPESGNWSIMDPGRIRLYTHFDSGRIRTFDDVRWTAAHEFGHALGIADGWGYGREGNGYTATQFGNYVSIMVGRGDPVTRLDMEMVLRAHETDSWQAWDDNMLLIMRHGIRR